MPIESVKLGNIGLALPNSIKSSSQATDKSFGDFLSEALENVNTLQKKADQASLDLAAGKIQDVSEVVIATEKATLALQLTVQVRNKMLESYQEMMRMQV